MILAATGLRREAEIIAGDGVRVVAGGGRGGALEAKLAKAAPEAEAIISLGLGGGLSPDLAPGDWVVATSVVWPGGELATDPAWAQALLGRLPGARAAKILGSDVILLSPTAKAEARAASGAMAVDMESQVAAQIARRFGLPFAAARVISDGAADQLPPIVTVGLAADGALATGAVMIAVLRAPGQIPALIRTARMAGRAFRALTAGRGLLGSRLGRPDLGELALHVG